MRSSWPTMTREPFRAPTAAPIVTTDPIVAMSLFARLMHRARTLLRRPGAR